MVVPVLVALGSRTPLPDMKLLLQSKSEGIGGQFTMYCHRSSFEKSNPGPEKTEGASIMNEIELQVCKKPELDVRTRV